MNNRTDFRLNFCRLYTVCRKFQHFREKKKFECQSTQNGLKVEKNDFYSSEAVTLFNRNDFLAY